MQSTYTVLSLRLSCLRQRVLIQDVFTGRRFYDQTRLITRGSNPSRPIPTGRPYAHKANTSSSTSKPPQLTNFKPSTPAKPRLLQQAGGNSPPTSRALPFLMKAVTKTIDEDGKLLIYTSPDHGTFYLFSYFCGLALILYAALLAEVSIKERKGVQRRYWQKILFTGLTIAVASMATALVLAPFNLIRSMTLLKSGVVHMEIKRNIPFLKPDLLETTIDKLSLERRLAATSLSYQTVPIEEAKAWSTASQLKPPRKSVLTQLSDFNRGLLDVWPTIKRETRRMAWRDQLAYVQVKGNGRFKMDLQECRLLGGTQLLESILPVTTHQAWWTKLFRKT